VGAESRERKLIEEKLPGAHAFPPVKYAKVCVPLRISGTIVIPAKAGIQWVLKVAKES
jgi:hypothetical protein